MTCRLVESVLTQGTRQGERQLCGAARASRTNRIEAQKPGQASLTVLSVGRPSHSSTETGRPYQISAHLLYILQGDKVLRVEHSLK